MLGPVEVQDEVGSTNAVLLERARAGAPAGAVLVARHQTAGRGRLDRTWEAPRDASLLVSVLLRPSLPLEQLHLLTVLAGLAAADACQVVAGVSPSLKWPNDLVIDVDGRSRKLAGLLGESIVQDGRPEAVVIGMGLNVNWPHDPPAGGVALNQLTGRAVDKDALLDAWLAGLDRRCGAGFDGLRAEHRARCSTIGREVVVQLAGREVRGSAVDIDDAGSLVVRHDGRLERFSVGDVVHARVSPLA